jgi:C1A family cysteine protease
VTMMFGMSEKIANSSCSQEDIEQNIQLNKQETLSFVESDSTHPAIVFSDESIFIHLPFIMNSQSVSDSFDWRNYQGGNWLTPIRNQGDCGSCWAFAAIGVTEAALNIASGNPNLDKNLSEQYLVSDCDREHGSCCGGIIDGALDFIRNEGVPDESCLPYIDGNSCQCDDVCKCAYNSGDEYICSNTTCSNRCGNWSSRLKTISQYGYVSSDRNSIKQKLREIGPLAAAMNFEEDNQFDENGVYHCNSGDDPNHAIMIVGYNDIGGYWIIRNSWGSTWNGDGYFKLGYGECFIEQEVIYASAE